MELRKTVFLLATALLFVSTVSAQNIQVEGLVEKDINTSFQQDGIQFSTDYLNKTVPYKDVMLPQKWHDDLNYFQASFQTNNVGQSVLQVRYQFMGDAFDSDNDVPERLGQYQYEATQQVNNEQIQFQVQSQGNQGSLKDEQVQAQYQFNPDTGESSTQYQYQGETRTINRSNPELEFDLGLGVIQPQVSAYYEHLIVNQNVFSNHSFENRTEQYESVYSGEETQKIPVSGSVEQLSASKVQQSITKNNLYEERTTEKLVVAHQPETDVAGIDWNGLEHERLGSVDYGELVQPELDSAGITSAEIENPEAFEFTSYNVTYPEDSERTVEINYSQPIYNPLEDDPEDFQFDYYSYIIGSVATFKTDTSSDWENGVFSDIEENSGKLEIAEKLDGFEDGDYSSDPVWTSENMGTISVQNSTSIIGNNAVKLESNNDGDQVTLSHDRGSNDAINDGDVYSFWIRTTSTSGSYNGYFGLSNEAGKVYQANDGIVFGFNSDEFRILNYDGTGSYLAEGTATGASANTWYNLELEFDTSNNNVDGRIYDTSGNLESSITDVSYSGVSNIQYVILEHQEAIDVFFDDVRYSEDKLFSNGDYVSKIYSAGEKKVWDNITVSNFAKNGGYIDIWVKTSNDGFSSVVEKEKISSSQLSSSGTQTVDLGFTKGATDVRYNISMDKGSSSPSIDSISLDGKTANSPPDSVSVVNPSNGASGTDDSVSLEASVSDPDGDSMDVTFYDASDDSQIGNVQTGVSDGGTASVSWNSLEWGTQYSWYAVADDGKASTQSSTFSFTTQYAPALTSAEFIDDRASSVSKLLFGVDDFGEADIDSWSGSGVLNSLTDSQLDVDVSTPVSSDYSVSDTLGAVSNTYSVDLSETDSGIREDSYSHSLGTQRVNRTVSIFNDAASSIDYELVLDLTGTVIQGQSWTGTISGASSVTHTGVTESDWITEESESRYDRYADSDYSHTEDQQRIHNRTQLDVENQRSFSFSSVDVSSICSRTTSASVPSGASTVTTDCNRPTFLVDTITQSVTELQQDGSTQSSLSTQYGYKRKDLTENEGYSYSSVDVSAPSLDGSCENCNTRTRDISASSTVSEYYNSSSDWITNEAESTYTKYSDSRFNHTEDGQQIVNRTQLVADNSQSFTFNKVDISGTCSETASADISPATGFLVTNDCNRPTFQVDVISSSLSQLRADSSKQHGLNTQYVEKDKTLSENGGFSWSNVDIFAPSIAGSCSDCGTRTRDISSTGSVTETYHASADWISGQTETDYNEVGESVEASHSLDTQYSLWETRLVVDNFQDFEFASVDLSAQCENTGSADIPSGTGVQVTTNCSTVERSGDFITNEVEASFDKYSDSGFDHGEDQQRIVNRTSLVADNSKSYSYSSVDISSECSETASSNVPSGSGVQVTSDCNRPAFFVDFISESVGNEFVDSSYSHGLDSQGLAVYKNISETQGYSFSGVNVSAPVVDGSCENCDERTTDVSGNGEASFVYNSSGDWIVNETRNTFSRYSDPGFNHSEDGQQIVNRTELVVDNSRGSEFNNVDISGTCSETVSETVSSGSDVQVTSDCTRNSFSGDWISTSTTEEASDSSYGHSLDSQGVFVAKNLSEEGGYNWDNVSVSTPSINGSCVNCGVRNVSLSPEGSVTEYYNATSDWIEIVSESTTEIGQNTSIEASVDQQTLYNQSKLSVDNNRSFSFNGVDVSSKCSTTTSVDVPSGESQVTEACNNNSFSGDWITNEENSSTQYVSGDVLIGEQVTESFEAGQEVEVTNVRSSSDLTIDLDSMLESVPGCTLQNSTSQEIPASTASSLDFQKSCTPGSHLNRTPVLKTETSDFYKYDIEFGFQVNSNLTEEQNIRYAVKKEWLDNWNNRDPTETEAFVNGRSQDVSVDEQIFNDTEYVVITVGDEYGNSSLHTGTHQASLSYFESKSPGSTSGTSGGGGTLISSSSGEERLVENVSSDEYNWTVSIVSTEDSQSYQVSGYPGASFENFVVLRNTGDSNVTLDVECEGIGEACDWVDLDVDRVVLNRNDFSEKVVTVSGTVPESFSGEDAPARFSIKVSDPRAENVEDGNDVGVEYVDFTVTNNPISGRVLDTALKVFEWRELESPVSWGNPIPYPFVFLPALLTLLFSGVWWGLERNIPVKSRPDSRWVVSIAVFLVLFVVL